MGKFSVKHIVAIGIGAALFFVLGRFVAIPSPVANTTISIQYGLLGFVSCLFGPIVGCLVGLIGHTLIDFSYGWGIWWSWVIASGVTGLIMGLSCKKTALGSEKFGVKSIIRFNVYQIIANLVAWLVVAPVLDILIYSEPADKVFVQGAWAAGANIVTTAVVGTLLCIAYAAAKPKKNSLEKK